MQEMSEVLFVIFRRYLINLFNKKEKYIYGLVRIIRLEFFFLRQLLVLTSYNLSYNYPNFIGFFLMSRQL